MERAVFAMPLLPDFSVTYQWLRELRRWHGERMVAAHFLLSGDEHVFVGRYNAVHARLSLRDAVRRVIEEPLGNEIVVTRSIRRREVLGIRTLTQRVGWTEVPEPGAKFDCLCMACVPRGTPDLLRRARAAFERAVLEARNAKSSEDAIAALRRLDTPLERADGRIPPDKLLLFVKAQDDDVRRTVAGVLGRFRWAQVGSALTGLLLDSDERVRRAAVESIVRVAGARRAYEVLASGSDEALSCLVEHLEYEPDVVLAATILSGIAGYANPAVLLRVVAAATVLSKDDDLKPSARARLEPLVSSAR
jgi:hypothetical protein